MADNVERCRERLFETWEESFKGTDAAVPRSTLRSDFHGRVARAIKKVFEKNILLGNALSMKRVDEKQNDLEEPIVFTEWKFALGDKLKREEYRFDVLLEGGAAKNKATEMTFDFFGDASASVNWMVDPDDPEKKRMIPAPSKVYPLIDYWRIGDE